MYNYEVFTYPGDEMVLECAFNDLMEEIRAQELVDVRTGKFCREWLQVVVIRYRERHGSRCLQSRQ